MKSSSDNARGVVLGTLAALSVLVPSAAVAQSTIVDIRGLSPRELKTDAFTLSSAQDLQIEAVGAESESMGGKFTWVTAIWHRET